MILPTFSHPELEQFSKRLKGLTRRTIAPQSKEEKRAAVLVTMCTVKGEPGFLFTKRTDDVPTHKGQVSFPGGMRHENEDDPIETALRETMEEIKIAPENIKVLGVSHDVHAITGVPVTPVVGFIGEVIPETVQYDPREIACVFCILLKDLLPTESRYRVTMEKRGSYPVFESGPWPVWGLTAYMLDEYLRDILLIDLWPSSSIEE